MIVNRTNWTMYATILVVGFAAPARAQDKEVSKAEFDAKSAYCKTCHGISGQGFRGSFPMPRLAGQQPEYLQNQLQAFIDRRRHSAWYHQPQRRTAAACWAAVSALPE